MRRMYLLIILTIMVLGVGCGNTDGTGVKDGGQAGAATCPASYTAISTAADLKTKLKDGNICLTADIELENWKTVDKYSGTLDGNNKTLTIKSFGSGAVGLIKEIAADGEVKDLSIELEEDLTSSKNNVYVGVLAGENKGRIDNVNVKSDKKVETTGKDSRAGGLVGGNSGTITNSYATGAVSASSESSSRAGGLVGHNDGTITNSYAKGAVSGHHAGGLVGFNYVGTIKESYAQGKVTASGSSSKAGGLVGGNSKGTITNSYATGNVEGQGSAGGLVGENYKYKSDGKIENSYATGDVFASGSSSRAGGLVGVNSYNGTITNSYATGAVTGNRYAGGLVGDNSSSGKIENSYATGAVSASGSSSNAGGLVGYNTGGTIENSYATGAVTGTNLAGGLVGDNEDGTITNSFVLSSALKPVGRGSDNGVEAIAKSAIKGTTFTDAGWSRSVWKNLVARQWPKLSWQTQQ